MNNRKEKILQNVAKIGMKAAISGHGFKSWLGLYQPETPKRLTEIVENAKKK